MQYAYLFEIRGIQRFLFATGKLRDMLAGSELLDHVCSPGGLLDDTLKALDMAPLAPRRAGGTFYLVFNLREQAERFRAAWRLAFPQWVPGVESVDVLAEGETIQSVIRAGIAQLSQQRNLLQADLPRPGPLAERSPRTGLAAVSHAAGESLDLATTRLRQFERPAHTITLERRFLGSDGYSWPRNFEQSGPRHLRFPLGENRLVALVHADGNGIGRVLRILNQATRQADDTLYVQAYSQFSEGLARITQSAARQASQEVLVPHAADGVLPARPLVLGGDDMSILVRSDLAVAYTRSFLHAFQQHSRVEMQALAALLAQAGLSEGASQLPPHLSASAGICHAKASFPFQTTHALAESLCKRAKDQARGHLDAHGIAPAMLAIQKMEGAVAEDAETLYRQFHCVAHDQEQYQLSLPAYALEPVTGLPWLDDLEALAACTGPNRLNDRPLRELATLWRQDIDLARQAYVRWRQLAQRAQPHALSDFDRALTRLLGHTANDLPCSTVRPALSPLSDLLLWTGIHQSARVDEEITA